MEGEAVEAFVERMRDPLVGALLLYCRGDRAAAEDLAQEALARAWERWQRIDRPEAWTYRVAFNLARSRWRRRHRESAANQAWSSTAPDAAELSDAGRVLRTAIAALPGRQRLAVVLRYDLDLPVAEVAAIMGCSDGTAKATLNHARAALRLALPDLNEVNDA